MTLFDIPVGFASVFMLILIGYFVLTVWFGAPQPIPQTQKASAPRPMDANAEAPRDLAG